MAFERLHTRLVLVVPNFDGLVVGARNNVRLVAGERILERIDALFVTFERKVSGRRVEAPHFDSAIKRSRRKSVGVLKHIFNVRITN